MNILSMICGSYMVFEIVHDFIVPKWGGCILIGIKALQQNNLIVTSWMAVIDSFSLHTCKIPAKVYETLVKSEKLPGSLQDCMALIFV